MSQGVLPGNLSLRLLDRISPSRFSAFTKCSLQEICITSKVPAMLPCSPAAKIGIIIHQLLTLAGKGQISDPTPKNINTIWNRYIEHVHHDMDNLWLERQLVPLQRSLPDYEVRKIRACRRLCEIAQGTYGTASKDKYRSRSGFWVESIDKAIGGYIDNIVYTNDGATICDYKTGVMTDISKEGNPIKKEYQLQMKLYAALYHDQHREWPIRLEVCPVEGPPRVIDFTPEECERLLKEAATLLRNINKKVGQILKLNTTDQDFTVLATPDPSTCRFCLYRPICGSYTIAKSTNQSRGWPDDVWGTISSINRLHNGRLMIQLNTKQKPLVHVTIRSLTLCKKRHPALEYIENGSELAAFNLRKGGAPNSFLESKTTILYTKSIR